ncbi:hypothetical protein [Yinghuangia seranimata]|uniref:hypothetical protein n=1 Tax=Yinghuangia seranimata TaxID=408067 RepID=UPI00248A9954|nr:hypothetical protein [Yinghuangia seranimata]MDI2130706.1 hypothetical protein [Yinghuangia seranimata]
MMIIAFLGFLLVAASAAFAALLIAYNTSGGPEYTVSMFDNNVVTLNVLAIFVTGLAIALIFCLGVAMAAIGIHSSRQHAHHTTDEELSARAARHAEAGEWQADPTLWQRRQAATTQPPDTPGTQPSDARGTQPSGTQGTQPSGTQGTQPPDAPPPQRSSGQT